MALYTKTTYIVCVKEDGRRIKAKRISDVFIDTCFNLPIDLNKKKEGYFLL